MHFAWPAMLWSLLALPALLAAYFLFVQWRRRRPGRDASLRMVEEWASPGRAWRHAPAVMLLAAIAALLVSSARPSTVLPVPSHHATVILAIDVSHSMQAQDVYPSRLAAAKEAANSFVEAQGRSTRIGIVAFSGEAMVVQAPTADRDDVRSAIEALHPRDATAIGAAIETSLRALFPPEAPPRAPDSAAIILLSDGQNTAGPDASEAALQAAGRGVRVYTVGFGTPSGTTIGGPGWSVHVHLDEDLLRNIADTTGAQYLHAETAAELKSAYATLNATLVLERRTTELTAFLCAAAALVALAAAGMSLVSFRRVA